MVEDKETLPLIVTGPAGRVLGLFRMNHKAYTKSLESGRLWHVHGETGRVLPLDVPGTMTFLHAGKEWFDAGVSSDTAPAGDPSEAPPAPGVASGVLEALATVIAQRRKDMPEGSYTTHLFASGTDKIKKKLGEEAVELILAKGTKDITYEAADLLYHLLVFLEDAGISLHEVFAELRRRG